MKNLNQNNLLFSLFKNHYKCFLGLLAFYLLASCQSIRVFEMKTDTEKELNVITVKSNRIVQECYFMNASDENQWRHQYLLHILNDKNEVISIIYPTNQDIDSCKAHLKKVERVLKNSTEVKMCARDILEKMDKTGLTEQVIDFDSLGKHASPYYFLTFDTICNDKNKCYSISDTWNYTCPEFKTMKHNN